MNHIDLGTVLRQTLSASLYSNLVTRPTGRAVRSAIETMLESSGRSLTVIDFSDVRMIDFSCADEVIAKLLLQYSENREAYFLFRGMKEDHLDAIESVLERHGLALVMERESGVELFGVVNERESRVYQAVKRRGRAESWELAVDLADAEPNVRSALDSLWRRRLIMRSGDAYTPLSDRA